MNNLTVRKYQGSFNFLAEKSKIPANQSCGLAWINSSFHLAGNNYFIYTCHSCSEKQIKKGKKPQECLNWGANHE